MIDYVFIHVKIEIYICQYIDESQAKNQSYVSLIAQKNWCAPQNLLK